MLVDIAFYRRYVIAPIRTVHYFFKGKGKLVEYGGTSD